MAVPIDRINTKDILIDEVTNLLNSFPVHIYFNIRGKLLMIDRSELLYLPHCLLGMLFIHGFRPLLQNEGSTPQRCLKCHLIDPAACTWLLNLYLRLFLKNSNYSPWKIKEDPLKDTKFVLLLVEFCDIYIISEKVHQGVNSNVKEKLLDLYYKDNNIFETSPNSLFLGNKKERSAFVQLLNKCGISKGENWSQRVKEPKRMSLSSYHVTTLCSTAKNAGLCQTLLQFWRKPGVWHAILA
ncbi:phosphatase activator [Schizosaccharomyces octosporus yFS286]|uniref:Phosphatase activator n=1 Tax=Schizosaccharomyces octosporus (strain yFS286) TaxID=483514 RepID=S9R906_SCHOY|nr:phosphatase activator [Schizosaccharomyces octosporus yFS286]EPX70584.1 phosphatase activator [Schizosaccharomyces octosporus yFS286]